MHRANFLKALAGLGFVAAVPKIETEEEFMVPDGTLSEGDCITFSGTTMSTAFPTNPHWNWTRGDGS